MQDTKLNYTISLFFFTEFRLEYESSPHADLTRAVKAWT